jgi:hypothetical protein
LLSTYSPIGFQRERMESGKYNARRKPILTALIPAFSRREKGGAKPAAPNSYEKVNQNISND